MIAAESERKKFLDQLLYTEQELAAARGREKVLQEQLIKEISDSGERLKKQLQTSSELEVHLFESVLATIFFYFLPGWLLFSILEENAFSSHFSYCFLAKKQSFHY